MVRCLCLKRKGHVSAGIKGRRHRFAADFGTRGFAGSRRGRLCAPRDCSGNFCRACLMSALRTVLQTAGRLPQPCCAVRASTWTEPKPGLLPTDTERAVRISNMADHHPVWPWC
jgi:hypothetical protein